MSAETYPADEAVEPAEDALQRYAEQALARSWLSQKYPVRVTPLAYVSVGPLSLLLEVRGRQCMPEVLDSLGDLGESLILRTQLRLPRRCNGRVRKLFRRGLTHNASPSVECGAPTVGETAASDDALRDSSGAANQGGAK